MLWEGSQSAGRFAGSLALAGLAPAEIHRASLGWAEVLGLLAMPVAGSLLLAIGTLALLFAAHAPGFGVAELLSVACLALFFWSRWFLRLVGWEEVALIMAGTALLALEVLVIPGLGVAGILGAVLLFLGFTLSLVGEGVTLRAFADAVGQIALAALLALAGGIVLLRALPHLPFGRRIVLKTGLGEGGWDARSRRGALIQAGARGTTLSPLRPAGVAEIAGARTDVVSDGEYVPSGQPIEVIRLEESRIVVRRVTPERGELG